jgi:hypothetical protein
MLWQFEFEFEFEDRYHAFGVQARAGVKSAKHVHLLSR